MSKVILNNGGSVSRKIRTFPDTTESQKADGKLEGEISNLERTGYRQLAYTLRVLKNSLFGPVVIRLISK